MIELIQFPCSPFCIALRRILEFGRAPFKITNIPVGDRSLVWRLTRQRYYQVPIIRDDLPRFVDFDLFGMLGNFLFSGRHQLPVEHTRLQEWHSRMARIRVARTPL